MSIVKAAFTVGTLTLFSRIIGFIRECVMAFVLGAGIYSDAILVALRLSNTLRRIFAEGAFNASFLPRFSKCYTTEGKEQANILLSEIFSFLLVFISILSVAVIYFFPNILLILVSGFEQNSEKFSLTVDLSRICFPYLLFISITSLFCGALNTLNKFALPAAVYSLLSIFTMTALLFGYFAEYCDSTISYIVSWFVVLAGIAQCAILYSQIKKLGFSLKFFLNFWSEKVQDITKNMIPGIIGAGVWQLNLLVDTTISSYLPTGTITCINLADRINQFPLGTLGIALSTALLPILSKHISVKDFDSATKELERGLLFAFFLTFFATSLLTALPLETIAVAFQRGHFGYDQVQITSYALLGFALGLPAYVLAKVFATVFFANGDTKTPVIVGILSVVINIIFLLILVPFLKYLGLALCTSISSMFNAVILIVLSRKILKVKLQQRFFYKITAQAIAAIVMFCFLRFCSNHFWTYELCEDGFKWIVYFAIVLAGTILFFLTTIAMLKLFKEQQWRLWKKNAW